MSDSDRMTIARAYNELYRIQARLEHSSRTRGQLFDAYANKADLAAADELSHLSDRLKTVMVKIEPLADADRSLDGS